MQHIFDVEIATEYGILEAILLNNIHHWVVKNMSNNHNFYDGRYWTYNSTYAFGKLFPYSSQRTILRALKNLEDKGIILTANYNKENFDRTKWYTLSDFGFELVNDKMANSISQNDLCVSQNDLTIPYINKHININNNINNNIIGDLDNFFNSLWKLYPKKKGKGNVSKTQKKKLMSIGYEELCRCIDRYKKFIEGKDEQYVMYGSTFFNSGYVDYLDENTDDFDKTKEETTNDKFSQLGGDYQ